MNSTSALAINAALDDRRSLPRPTKAGGLINEWYPITATVAEFCRLSGVGRSKLYEMMKTGEVESVQLGGRRLIVIDSWRQRVAEALRSRREPAGPDTAANDARSGGAAR